MWHLSLLRLVKGTPVNFGYISLCGLSSSRGRCYALALGLCGMSHSSLLMVYECVCLHTLGIVRDSLTQVPGPDAGPRTEKLLSEGSLKCTAAAWGRWSTTTASLGRLCSCSTPAPAGTQGTWSWCMSTLGHGAHRLLGSVSSSDKPARHFVISSFPVLRLSESLFHFMLKQSW